MSTLLEQASLVLIPSGYKEDTVYSVIPSNGSGDLSFTRASNGTRINSDGLVENTSWNLFTYSEQFQNANWTGGGNGKPTMTDNFAEAPNGTFTASKMEAVSDAYQLRQNNAIENTQMNLSVYLRTNTGTKTIQLILNNGTTAFSNLTVTTTWQRFEISGTVTTLDGSGRNGLATLEALTSSEYILVWGAQISVSSTAKPYFPTTDRLNVPRLTYQNGGGGCPSLLLEPQRTNVLTYSQELNDLTWTKTNVTVTANTNISPDGTQNADLVNFDAISGARLEKIIAGAFENQTHTITVFAKVTSGTQQFRLKCTHGAVVDYFSSDFTATTTWQRFTFTQTFGASIGTSIVAGIINSTSATAKSILFYGIQLETNSSYASSYIPTTSASATRIADACSKTGISSLIGQTEGTLFLDFDNGANDGVDYVFGLNDGTADNRIIIYRSSGARVVTEVRRSGTPQATIQTSPVSANSRNKCAIAYKANDIAFYVNGVQVGVDTSATIPTCSGLYSNGGGGSSPFLRPINEIIVFKTRLTNDELASLTTI
jgi:hypothetical protein